MAGLGGCKELNYGTFPEWQQPYIRSYVENESQDSIGLFLQAYEQLKQESK